MPLTIKRFIKPAICMVFLLSGTVAKAQVSLIQNMIDKLESYNNFSYQFIHKNKDLTVDTAITQNKELFLKAPADKTFGYLFRLQTVYKTEKFTETDLYNGHDLTYINPEDSTYGFHKVQSFDFGGSLLGSLKTIRSILKKRASSKVVKVNDTTINGITNSHLIATISDTIINNEHLYSRRDLYIDKQIGLPSFVTIRGRGKYLGDVITDYYDEVRYFDYKFDQTGIDTTTFSVPKGFHPPQKSAAPPALLAPGSIAPNWTLYDANGNKTSLAQMKGKVVVLDFYFIGCWGCMLSLQPLNTIHEKYNDKNVVIASITERDSEKKVLAFEKQYHIKYPGYVNAADVVKSYHVSAFPTFYFIDKEGKIANVIVGYSDGFEAKTTAIIDKLLNK
jgi:peroxiredoxin